VLLKDSLVKKSGKVSIMMKNLKKPGSRRAEDSRKYEAEKSRVVVTWPAVAMYLRASCAPLVALLFLCHVLRTSVVVMADFWLAAWSVAAPEDAASANTTVCECVISTKTRIRSANSFRLIEVKKIGILEAKLLYCYHCCCKNGIE